MKDVAQGALDQVRKAAQKKMKAAAAATGGIEGGESTGISGDGNVERVFAGVARKISTSKIATLALGMAGYAESGMRDLPGGDASSEGGLQLLASTAAGMGIDPHDEGAVASAFLQRGYYGKGGANALAAQGLPAHLVAQGAQGSAFSDGSNYLAQEGSARAWMRRFGLRRGGPVGLQAGGSPQQRAARNASAVAGRAAGALSNARTAGRSERLTDTLSKIRGGDRNVRRAAVRKLVEKISGVGLPKALTHSLSKLAIDANVFGEYADRAGQLNIEDDDGNIATAGLVGGRTQVQWLEGQLSALFQWRNAIVQAEQIVVRKREETAKLIADARSRLSNLSGVIGAAGQERRQLAAQLEKAKRKPKANKALIKTLTGQIKTVDGAQSDRKKVRDALSSKILPALGDKRSSLNTARGDLLTNLEDVQGAGSPTMFMRSLPAVGVLGGRIFDTQMLHSELTAVKPRITDTETSAADSERTGLLEQLLREANLRTAVSERQFEVFKNMPPYGGSFADGGPVPGPIGAPRTIVAHGGERVLTADEARGGSNVRVIVHGDIVSDRPDPVEVLIGDQRIEAAVERVTRRQARHGARGLPGLPGVLR